MGREGPAHLTMGRLAVNSLVSGDALDALFCVIHFGSSDFRCGLVPYPGEADHARLEEALFSDRLSLAQLLREVDRVFTGRDYSLRDLFLDGRRRVAASLLEGTQRRYEADYQRVFDDNSRLMLFLAEIDSPVPVALRVAAEVSLTRRILAVTGAALQGDVDPEMAEDELTGAVQLARTLGAQLDMGPVRKDVEKLVRGRMAALVAGRGSHRLALELVTILDLARHLGLWLDLWSAQNLLWDWVHGQRGELDPGDPGPARQPALVRPAGAPGPRLRAGRGLSSGSAPARRRPTSTSSVAPSSTAPPCSSDQPVARPSTNHPSRRAPSAKTVSPGTRSQRSVSTSGVCKLGAAGPPGALLHRRPGLHQALREEREQRHHGQAAVDEPEGPGQRPLLPGGAGAEGAQAEQHQADAEHAVAPEERGVAVQRPPPRSTSPWRAARVWGGGRRAGRDRGGAPPPRRAPRGRPATTPGRRRRPAAARRRRRSRRASHRWGRCRPAARGASSACSSRPRPAARPDGRLLRSEDEEAAGDHDASVIQWHR